MKNYKNTILLFIALFVSSIAYASDYRLREEVRFITDKMAYELRLDSRQYQDVFQINYDFIDGTYYLRSNLLAGSNTSYNRYYTLLDYRNEDLRWVLTRSQYREFLRREYFHRPYYASQGRLTLRVYINYRNHNHYYYAPPRNYRSYRGAYRRDRRRDVNYYGNRYQHSRRGTYKSIRGTNRRLENARRSDFGNSRSSTTDRYSSSRPSTTRQRDNTRSTRDKQRVESNRSRNNERSTRRTTDRNTTREVRKSTNRRSTENRSNRSSRSSRESVRSNSRERSAPSRSSNSTRNRTNARRSDNPFGNNVKKVSL